ncbi:MAG: hypothetical protein D6768_10460, partial [Chloroflexi bacterium]
MGLRNFLWLLLLAALWGPSFIFIKLAVEDIPPITMAAGRVGFGRLFLAIPCTPPTNASLQQTRRLTIV